MKISILERLLHAERHRRKLQEGDSSFVPPVATSFSCDPGQGPWVTSLSQGKFAATHQDKQGFVAQAFTDCPLEEEGRLLRELYGTLITLRGVFRWTNVCKTIVEAKHRMALSGFEAKCLVVPFADLEGVVGSGLTLGEAEMLMLTQGCVADVGGVKILTAGDELPKGSAILSTVPSIVGVYNRVYDHVGITIFQADRSLVLVSNEVD
jgi:hypothetical protein